MALKQCGQWAGVAAPQAVWEVDIPLVAATRSGSERSASHRGRRPKSASKILQADMQLSTTSEV